MRAILCGKNAAAVSCLEWLVQQGDEVLAVATAGDDGSEGWQPSFRGAAQRLAVAWEQPRDPNAPDFVARLAAYRADVLLSIQYDRILRRRLLDSLAAPCLNLHFALLPRQRGVAPIPWAILAGDAATGVTLHQMILEIDAGDVIAQRSVPIGIEATARELYDEVCAATSALFRECHPFPPALLASRQPQDLRAACYHAAGELDFSRREVDWSRPAAELQRWIRALIFPPLQAPETWLGARRLTLHRVAAPLAEPAGAAPGTVLSRSAACLDVAAGAGAIRILELREPAQPAASPQQLIDSIPVGARLGIRRS